MLEILQKIFSDISLSEIDSIKDIENSQIYKDFLFSYPNLSEIFESGVDRDIQEFIRTIKHIFRSIKIFLKLLSNSFCYEGFSEKTNLKISKKLKRIQDFDIALMPLILIYHDIGKFIRKRDHPQQSYILISGYNLLEPYNLAKNDRILIEKVIQYHILFATIYTGESTYYGTYSLLNDSLLSKLISDKIYLDLFVDLLEVFTFIDILGYSYSQIFDHYVIYYEEINRKLKNILALLPEKEQAIQKAFLYSFEWIDWRIAGGLRIFQFIGTKHYLSEEFYYNLIKSSLKAIPFDEFNLTKMEWEELKNTALKQSCRIQIKYGLAFLMILAFGSFHQASIKEDTKISHKLLLFWILICRETLKQSVLDEDRLWNVYIIGIPNWLALSNRNLLKIDDKLILKVIQQAELTYDKSLREYILKLDLSLIFLEE
jgi:hypothetical protein